ncbi:hypothetical protein [Streptomyces sp. bgisy027]|uniref:hypothetical protein n=1 Tax=Streptomyces sp. bgisy027 TaxID=3413770 RepID=UPI003D70CC6E
MSDRILYFGTNGRIAVGAITANNGLQDLASYPAGAAATDWTQITALSGDRILYYAKSSGRMAIGTVDANNGLQDLASYPAGAAATDWTQITALSGDRILYYAKSSGRVAIGAITPGNGLKDLASYPAGSAATDWTQITALSGDRILYYAGGTGRVAIGAITPSNGLKDLASYPAGSAATDWTSITGVSGDRILYYAKSSGRVAIGAITPGNGLKDLASYPAGTAATDWKDITFVGSSGKPSPWAVLLCQFSDATAPPAFPRKRFEELFVNAGTGKLGMVDFFRDMSHGNLDLSTSKVFGWYALTKKSTEYTGSGGNPQGRKDLITWARQAAANAGVNLTPYGNRICVVTHPPTDLFGGPDGAVTGDGRDGNGMTSLSPSLMGQEMGHVYGLDHSWAGSVEYGDYWDTMSTRTPYMAPHPVFTEVDSQGRAIWRIGPGLNAANMWGAGWLQASRVWQAKDSETDTVVTLRPLHSSDLTGYLCARVGTYFIELRLKERWDALIPAPAVLVHEFKFNRSYLLTATATGGRRDLQKGDEFLRGDPNNPASALVRVRVLDIDPVARTARVGVTRRLASPLTDGGSGGLIVVGGKAVDVPSRSPLYNRVEEIAQELQEEPEVVAVGHDHAVAPPDGQGDLADLAASLADQLSQMESPREPNDGVKLADLPTADPDAADGLAQVEPTRELQNGSRTADVPTPVTHGADASSE